MWKIHRDHDGIHSHMRNEYSRTQSRHQGSGEQLLGDGDRIHINDTEQTIIDTLNDLGVIGFEMPEAMGVKDRPTAEDLPSKPLSGLLGGPATVNFDKHYRPWSRVACLGMPESWIA